MRCLALVAMLAGCIDARVVECESYSCPVGTVCVPTGCATPDQVTACTGLVDGDECQPHGHCLTGTCLDSVCGDGIVEFGELCDDRNVVGGDGCSATCTSNETCGDGVVNFERGEQCDQGVPMLSGDGCSSTCAQEIDLWKDVTPKGISPREASVMIWDPVSMSLVAFGGYAGGTALGDTWMYTAPNWTQPNLTVAPPARREAVFAWFPEEQRGILFGGYDTANLELSDTWAWQGGTWVPLTPAQSPPGRGKSALVYDEMRGKLILFGGARAGNPLGDTWSWYGGNWHLELQTSMAASARYEHGMAFDPGTNKVILFGGTGGDDSTYGWNGTTWNKFAIPADGRPPSRRAMAMARSNNVVLMFGGTDAAVGHMHDVWRFNGNQKWIKITMISKPEARRGAAATYWPGVGFTVMGGNGDNGSLQDLWSYDGAFHVLASGQRPISSATAPATYDPIAGVGLAIFDKRIWIWKAGQIWEISGPDHSELSGTRALVFDERRDAAIAITSTLGMYAIRRSADGPYEVTQLAIAQAPMPSDFDAVYDPLHERIVLVGAQDANPLGVWVLASSASQWEAVSSQFPPTARTAFSLAFDRARDRVVLFGGIVQAAATAETFEWTDAAWQASASTDGPSGRYFPMFVYDPLRQSTILFGGLSITQFLAETWEYNGAWIRRPDITSPSPRLGRTAFFDRANARMTLAGGFNGGLAETWRYDFEEFAKLRERCTDPTIDDDGDGVGGCDDPDCWGRCAPLCVPGEPCDPSWPRCGDGTCSATESTWLCAADCEEPAP